MTYLQESSDSYTDSYNLVRIGAVGGNLEAGFNTRSLSYFDNNALPQGGVSISTESVMMGYIYMDWIAVRPLADPEPDIEGWGDEEEIVTS